MSAYQPYPKYKHSGVEWLGDVPEGWEFLTGKRIFEQRKDPSGPTDDQLSATQKYGVIPQALFMEQEDQKVVLALSGTGSFKHVEKDDFVISLRSFQGGIEHSAYSGCVSPAYTVLRSKLPNAPRYFAQLLKCPQYIAALQAGTDGIREGKSISYDQFGQITIPVPPLPEQRQIAAFLDRECGKLDVLQAKQERLIELLKEKRQALISHAVTRGLDPTAKLKPSGSEWLDDVPTHWIVTRLKFEVSKIVDCPHETPKYDPDGEYLVIRTADVDRGRLDLSKAYRLDRDEFVNRTRRDRLRPNDIVYGREGERWGHAALVPDSPEVCLGQRMMQFRASRSIDPAFLSHLLNSTAVYEQGALDTVGATSPHVNISTIRNYNFPLPPLAEQRAIVAHLDEKCGKLDLLKAKAERAIELLKERRSALISAAVTGKIDVRKN